MCTSSVLDNRLRGVGIDFSLYICVCSIWVKYYSLHNNNNKCAETMTQRAEDGIRSKRNNCQRVGLLLELLAGGLGEGSQKKKVASVSVVSVVVVQILGSLCFKLLTTTTVVILLLFGFQWPTTTTIPIYLFQLRNFH